jgi:hypothetical protein
MKVNALLAVLLVLLSSCQSDPKSNLSTTNEATLSTTATTPQPVKTSATNDFELTDTSITTTVNKSVRLCLPLKTPIPAPNFNVVLTKSAINGTATPSVSDGQLCINYVPNANFTGKDQFDFKICNGASDCMTKTWKVVVGKEFGKEISEESSSETETMRPKNVQKKEALPAENPISPTPPVTRRSLFDPNAKNEDGYAPKNNN